ncbi:MAG: hypothetical protein ACTSUF_03530 [Candidatus Heimdallarchaeaceae archaeon]
MPQKDPRELRNGDNLEVVFVGGAVKYYQILKIDDIFYKDRHDALSSGGTESFTNVTALDPPIDQFYYFYSAEIDGNFRLLLKQPAATNRWGTNRSPQGGWLFDISSPVTSNRKIEIWCSENYPPAVQLENHTNVTIDRPIIWWIGRRFSVRKLDTKPANYTTIQIGGVAE